MRVLYLTHNVLGDPGANAAELFPKLAVASHAISHVVVADRERNLGHIRDQMAAECLILYLTPAGFVRLLRTAGRIVRRAKADQIDVIHAFYRQENVWLIVLIRLWLILFACPSRLIVDHRSVNLAKGARSGRKRLQNLFLQMAVHGLAGNPNAVSSNHWWVWKRSDIVDLGYDRLPPDKAAFPPDPDAPTIWYTGSMKPLNRKSDFLFEIFEAIDRRLPPHSPLRIVVAGSTNETQMARLKSNPRVIFLGLVEREDLYLRMAMRPGVGMAFMNKEYHELAPSLKFCEYAALRYRIAASDTFGLRQQADRFGIEGVHFVAEKVEAWADRLIGLALTMTELEPPWANAAQMSYESIFREQVLPLYQSYLPRWRLASLTPCQPVAEPRKA